MTSQRIPKFLDAEAVLAELDPDQREAAEITRGPLVIHAGAGSGKTRVISHRVAYAVATSAVDRRRVLVVTFTDKAATEMAARLTSLGLPGVAARTFHAAALAQLRYFWPSRHGGDTAPDVLDSKIPMLGRLALGLPGGYRFTPAKDLADEIEWAKSRRLTPSSYPGSVTRTPPIPAELFTRLWRDYEGAKDRTGKLDFDDMLTETVDLLESDSEAAASVRARYTWFSVDEYQDTNPLQQRLLELWLGGGEDVCVVGDEDQTIYSFTGATSEYLIRFKDRFPNARAVTLSRNYRSSPEVLSLANRLLAGEGRRKRLVATCPSGPSPTIRECPDGASELALITTTIRRLIDTGSRPDEIAVLVRMNAQIPPIVAALRTARVPFRIRGQLFYQRTEVRAALAIVRRLPREVRGAELVDAFKDRLGSELGFETAAETGPEARERNESLALLVETAEGAAVVNPNLDAAGLFRQFTTLAADEAAGSAEGVELLTLHRAKGLEWDAVLLPALEEGTLPIRQAEDDDELAEERRLLYVGLTRARRHLLLSWARRRAGPGDREVRRRPSRFLRDLQRGSGRNRVTIFSSPAGTPSPGRTRDASLLAALKDWRLERSRADKVPAYVVAQDATLEAIVDAHPTSLAGLRRVRGMGPARLERYGEEMLAVVRAAMK